MKARQIALWAGPVLFVLFVLIPASGSLTTPAKLTAGITLWMAVWWISEAVNPAVTSLLPLVLFPLCGIAPVKNISAEYGNEIIYLFFAGFLFGKTIEKWGLHRRIALQMITLLGNDPARIVLGFMLATGFISMWISNTATAVMMIPVAVAVATNRQAAAEKVVPDVNFSKNLMLGVGYAASIGGMATLVGTPTNAIFVGFVEQKMQQHVSFGKWFMVGFPYALVLMILCWRLLLRLFPLKKSGADYTATLHAETRHLGPITTPEFRLLLVFGLVIFCWISGSLLWYRWVSHCNDTVVAIAGAIALFLLPARGLSGESLLDWKTAVQIPWGVLVFFGGGLALAKGFDLSGLAGWIGEQMKSLNDLPQWLILLVALVVVVLLSEVASNVATATMMLPVLAAVAGAIGANPFGLLMTATLASSVGFGLPIATAPNSIAFGTGFIATRDMARAGFLLDVISVLLLLLFAYTVIPVVWGFGI